MKPPAIRKELFWDVDFAKIDFHKSSQLIIERVLNLGNIAEFKGIVNYYGRDAIKEATRKAGYLDPKTLEFVASYFNLEHQEIRCYIKKQLHQSHWS